jgi:uncharacterized repeat protein (TIGR01451 family)
MVYIPDPIFRNWISTNCAGAIIGDSMNTQNSIVKTIFQVNLNNTGVSNLTGLEYFLNCHMLIAENGNLSYISAFPPSLTNGFLMNNKLATIPPLPPNLFALELQSNLLHYISALPNTINTLNLAGNQLDSLPILPNALSNFTCAYNNIIKLPNLPPNLTSFNCSYNNLDSLPPLPNSLLSLQCDSNNLFFLPVLPPFLEVLRCSKNLLDTLPALPSSLTWLDISSNYFTSMPHINDSIYNITISNNLISHIDTLPNVRLQVLYCEGNLLTSFPTLPATLMWFNCSNNPVTELPKLPNSIMGLDCLNNPLFCLPILPDSMRWLHAYGSGITCLPNIPQYPFFQSDIGYVTCNIGNENCVVYPIIYGSVFFDTNGNGVMDFSENAIENRTISISQANWFGVSNLVGNYHATVDTGTYSISMPMGIYESLTTTLPSATFLNYAETDSGNNFGIYIPQSINDLAINISATAEPFPGYSNQLNLIYSNQSGTTKFGTIELVMDSNYTYQWASVVPNFINGDTLIWQYSNLNPCETRIITVNLLFSTTASLGVANSSASIFPILNDSTPSNNIYFLTESVANSHDPNLKTVNPSGNINTTLVSPNNYKLDYTIHFQNTGNAAAKKIVLKDTLSSKLNLSSFKFIGNSHNCVTDIHNNILTVTFDSINLPDSTDDFEGSQGWYAYSISTGNNINNTDSISNSADIYFDFNLPIKTNQATTKFVNTSAVQNLDFNLNWNVFPNPTGDLIRVQFDKPLSNKSTISIIDVEGRVVVKETLAIGTTNYKFIGIDNLIKGFYFVCCNGNCKKVIIN